MRSAQRLKQIDRFAVAMPLAICLVLAAGTARAQDAAELAKRVQQLEEQLVDMQVVIGTLETMQGGGGTATVGPAYPPPGGAYGGGYSGGGGAGDSARLDGMETQIQALTAQMQQLTNEVRALVNGRRGDAAQPVGRAYATAPQSNVQSESLNDVTGGGFGSTTVTPGVGAGGAAASDGIGDLLTGGLFGGGGGSGGDAGAKQMYEKAYGYMLQQDYGAAEVAFRDFLTRYPSHELSGNAQFWLGESYYLRGEYKTAAGAFLEGYEKHRRNAKAPESLLKLAMSLDRLGQRDAACSSYTELNAQFPNAPDHIRRQAQTERRRSGC